MNKKSWPVVTENRETLNGFFHCCFGTEPKRSDDVKTTCKHGDGDCESCGTTERRDVVHVTERGVGKVGRLTRKR